MRATTCVVLLCAAVLSAVPGSKTEDAATAGPHPTAVYLNDAPTAPADDGSKRRRRAFVSQRSRRAVSTTGSLDTSNKASVASFFNANYPISATYTPTSDINPPSTCVAGDEGLAWRQETIKRVNMYRRLVGLSEVTLDTSGSNDKNKKCRKSALIMSANGQLSHTPPSSWNCYSVDGDIGAGSSNIAIGSHGPDSIDGYVDDPGSGNAPVGHRRWIFFPKRAEFATGDVGNRGWQGPGDTGGAYANSLWVFGATSDSQKVPDYVVWPNQGYVPYNLLPSSRRWSISVAGADFSSATVTAIRSDGHAYTVEKEKLSNGYGDNTLVFRLTDIALGRPEEDIEVDFAVSNVGGSPSEYRWTSTIFDPNPSPPCCEEMTLDGISHSIATTYTLKGKSAGYCYYANAAENRWIYRKFGSWRIGQSLGDNSIYAFNPDTDAGRPEDVSQSWNVWEGSWVAQPSLTTTCDKPGATPSPPTTPSPASTPSSNTPSTTAVSGVWYCRRPGASQGKFKAKYCSKPCKGAPTIQARCCRPNAGKACKTKEKLKRSLCLEVQPTCS